MPKTGIELADLVNRQIAAVDARVTGGGSYESERDEVRRAAERIDDLRVELGLGGFLESLTPLTGKPQFLLVFDSGTGPVVLKVYGRSRPAEARVLAQWQRAGVPVPSLRAHGDDPTSWLAMDLMPGRAPDLGDLATPADRARWTHTLAAVVAHAHRVGVPGDGGGPTLQHALARHIRAVVDALEQHGYALPPDWEPIVLGRYAAGRPVLLHGDLTRQNLLASGEDVRLIDPCGYVGPAEFDAARWCARTGGAAEAENLLRAWATAEPHLDHDLAAGLLGAEMLMEAGVRELVKDERGEPLTAPTDPTTIALLRRAGDLLGSVP